MYHRFCHGPMIPAEYGLLVEVFVLLFARSIAYLLQPKPKNKR